MTEINVSTGNRLNLKQSVYWESTQGHTGRTVRGGAGLEFATEWATLSTSDEMLNHPGAKELRYALRELTPLNGDPLELFRGRGFDKETPTRDDMGPPPEGKSPGQGRYDKADESVLYLSDSTEGVRLEREAWNAGGIPFVQRYKLPIANLDIANITECPSDHFTTAVFVKAEDCNIEGRGPDNYVFSQVVAQIVASQYEGMIVCGTRGQIGATYRNVVVFQPHPRWGEWLDDSEPFRLND